MWPLGRVEADPLADDAPGLEAVGELILLSHNTGASGRDTSHQNSCLSATKELTRVKPDAFLWIQIRLLDGVVRKPDGSATYRLNPPYKWVEMAVRHFSLLTERVELVDHRHIEDKLIEARERAVKAGHAKKHPDIGKAT